jgi:hypothetical protein
MAGASIEVPLRIRQRLRPRSDEAPKRSRFILAIGNFSRTTIASVPAAGTDDFACVALTCHCARAR